MVEGTILEWVARTPATAIFGPGATATFTATRTLDGGTILATTAQSAPFRYAPRRHVATESGGRTFIAAGSALQALDMQGVPCADYVTAVITQGGGTSTSGTVYMYYDRHRG